MMQVEGRNKELENEVLAMRKAAEQAVAEMRTLQNVRGRRVGNGALVADARLYKGLADYSVHCVMAAHLSAHASTRFTHRPLSTMPRRSTAARTRTSQVSHQGFALLWALSSSLRLHRRSKA